MKVVAEENSGEEALARVGEAKSDVVLLDLRMLGMSGIECTAALHIIEPDLRIIALTSFVDEEDVYLALQAGAHAYLLKDVQPAELLDHLSPYAHGAGMMYTESAMT